jgi:hypothetical protein
VSVNESQPRWSYPVHDGKVYCPRHSRSIDVAQCWTCVDLRRDASTATEIVCLDPEGTGVASMIEKVARSSGLHQLTPSDRHRATSPTTTGRRRACRS